MIVIILKVLLFIIIFTLMYFLLKKVIDERVIINRFNKMIKKTQVESEKRKLERQKEIEIQGTANDDTMLAKLDAIIEHSGIKKYIHIMNANLLIIFAITLFCVVFLITSYIASSVARGLIAGVVSIAILCLVILLLCLINYVKTEKEIITFINLLQNYSRTNADISNILGQMSPYLNEPLRTITEDCYLECISTGNIDLALEKLANKVNHKKLQIIIQNIALCAKYEANYESVINDSRTIIQEYLSGMQQRKAMLRNAMIEIGLIIGIGLYLLISLNSLVEDNIFTILMSTTIGNALVAYFIIILVVIAFIFFKENYSQE